jgi:tetratricopeptide (TPR) repeat protein
MTAKQNTVYLGYNQDTVQRLPAAIFHALRERGYDVFMETNHFYGFNAPKPSMLEKIERRAHYVLLQTPLSSGNDFQFREYQLRHELKQAQETGRHIILLLGYGLTRSDIGTRFLEGCSRVEIDDLNIIGAVEELDTILSDADNIEVKPHDNIEVTPPTMPTETQLRAEMVLNVGLAGHVIEGVFFLRDVDLKPIFEQVLSIDPNYAWAYCRRAKLYKTLAHEKWKNREGITRAERREGWRANADDGAKILAEYNKAIELEPEDARCYHARSEFYKYPVKNYDAALADLDKAVQFAPDESKLYVDRSFLHKNRGDMDAWINDISMAIRLNPQSYGLYKYRYKYYMDQGEFQLALEDINKKIEIEPYWGGGSLERGLCLLKLGRSDEAEEDWRKVVELFSIPERIYSTLVGMCMHFDEWQHALSFVEKQLKLEPDNKHALERRRIILEKLNAE